MNIAKGFSRNPDIEKARMEFERAQKVEQRFHKDFDGLDFTMSVACRIGSVLLLPPRFRAFHDDVRQDFVLFSLRCAWSDCVLQ